MLKFLQKLLNKLLPGVNAVHYLCGTEALPQPLTAEEEAACLAACAEGDSCAKDKLIEHNLRLVVFLAKKFESTGLDMDDVVSVGTIGLIKAVNSFKPEKQIKLATYASRCIENEILMQLRKTSKIKNDVSLDKPLSEDNEGNELVLGDIIPSGDDIVEETVDKPADNDLLHKFINNLNAREREIMILRYGLFGQEELTQREVAEKLGISQSYISRLEKRILGEMKTELQKSFSI